MASNVTKEDEAAAMAAMFQAQTQNWEETQEKMSQLVSSLYGFYPLYCRPFLITLQFALLIALR